MLEILLRKWFAESLRKVMKESKVTQAHLAMEIGVTKGTVEKWLSCKSTLPTHDKVCHIAYFFGISTDELYQMDKIVEYYDKH